MVNSIIDRILVPSSDADWILVSLDDGRTFALKVGGYQLVAGSVPFEQFTEWMEPRGARIRRIWTDGERLAVQLDNDRYFTYHLSESFDADGLPHSGYFYESAEEFRHHIGDVLADDWWRELSAPLPGVVEPVHHVA